MSHCPAVADSYAAYATDLECQNTFGYLSSSSVERILMRFMRYAFIT